MEGLSLKYFVLNPNKLTSYGKASRIAVLAYARSIRKVNKQFADDLERWIARIELKIGLPDGKH